MLVYARKSTICLFDAFLHLREERQAKSIARCEDYMIDAVKVRPIAEINASSFSVESADALLDGYIGVLERLPSKGCDRIAADGCVHGALCVIEDFVDELMGRD